MWVVAPDGMVRGHQRFEGTRAISEGGYRTVDVAVRTVPVLVGDRIVVAVHEAGGPDSWRRDVKTIEQQVRASMAR